MGQLCSSCRKFVLQCVLLSHNNLRCVFYTGLTGYKYFKMLSNGGPQMLTDLQSMWSSTRFTRQDKLFKSLVMTQKRDQMCVHRVHRWRPWMFSSDVGICVYTQWTRTHQLRSSFCLLHQRLTSGKYINHLRDVL